MNKCSIEKNTYEYVVDSKKCIFYGIGYTAIIDFILILKMLSY